MKIYYKIPDSDNENQNKILGLLYELFKYRLMWHLRSIEKVIREENGIIFIDRTGDDENPMNLTYRLEGFTAETEATILVFLNQFNKH